MKFKQSEDDLQRAVANLLDHLGWMWQHVPGEMFLHGTKKQRAAQMAKLKAMGFKPGDPDVLIYERYDTQVHPTVNSNMDRRGFGIAIELKVGRNKTTPAQDGRLDDYEARGFLTAVCRSVGDVKRVLECVRAKNGRRV